MFRCEIISPDRIYFDEEVEMVVFPGTLGDFGVLALHAPMVSSLRPGVIEIWQAGIVERGFSVTGGFVEVKPESCVVWLEKAEPVEEEQQSV